MPADFWCDQKRLSADQFARMVAAEVEHVEQIADLSD
jgi:hypothetical protein